MLKAENYNPALMQGARIDPSNIASLLGLPFVNNIYYADSANGSDTANDGTDPDNAFKTVEVAKDATTANQHDVVVAISGSSSFSESEFDWDKNYTHLLGMAAPTRNSRARIFAASGATTPFATFSSTGSIISNVGVGTFEDINVNCKVTGGRSYFANVSFLGMGNATTGDDAAGRSIVLSGAEENVFEGCTIGLDTVMRSNVANAELEFNTAAKRNLFSNCRFRKAADGVGTLFVKTVGTSAVDRENEFFNTSFYSFWTNDSDKITAAFDVSSQTATGHFIMSGRQILIGADDWEGSASNLLFFEQYTETASKIGLGINNA